MIKGVRIGGKGAALSYLDTLTVPIIENTPHEEDLRDSMADVGKNYRWRPLGFNIHNAGHEKIP
jgi:methylthioribulose-1-phosphate dehydratase